MKKENWLIIFTLVLLLTLPAFARDAFQLHLLIVSGIYVVLAISLNLIFLTGQLSIAHGAMMGIGAYTSALMSLKLNWPVFICMPTGALVSGLVGFIIGLLVLRITGIYFAIVTFAFGEIVVLAFLTWESLFGGPNGILNIPSPTFKFPGLFEVSFSSKLAYYYLILLTVFIAIFIFRRFNLSYLGRACRAIAKSERLAKSIGINAMYYKLLAFSVGNLFAGLAGALYAHYLHYIGPGYFSFHESVHIIVAVVIGGVGTLLGPILGAIFLTYLPEFLRAARDYEMMIYAFILILVLKFMPEGLYGGLNSVKNTVRLFFSRGEEQGGPVRS